MARTLSVVVALLLAFFAAGIPVAGAVPASRAPGVPLPNVETCDAPVRRFRGGPGRGPGATVVPVEMRQKVRNAKGEFVSASSLQTKAQVEGDEVTVLVNVWNRSVYDVGNVVMRHQFKPAPGNPFAEGVASVVGAVYSDTDRTFMINRIEAGEEATFSFRIFLHGALGEGISQTKLSLEDFTVLDSSKRFPLPTSLTSPGRSRMNVERVGLGAVEVSCFEGTAAQSFANDVPATGRKAAEPERSRPPVMGYAPESEVPATAGAAGPGVALAPGIVMPQTGADMARVFLLALQVALGMMIGAGLFGAGLWVVARRL